MVLLVLLILAIEAAMIDCDLARTRRYKGAPMGLTNSCDDGQTDINVDWPEFGFQLYTCKNEQWRSNFTVQPEYFNLKSRDPSFNPKEDVVTHKCMTNEINYDRTPPLRGNHRPNWAVFGEYVYLPPQRWLHNLEHGSIVMLYHPCADPVQVSRLRTIVVSCLYRHVITPYHLLTKERPLVLLSWGAQLSMDGVDSERTRTFIKDHAKRAPEDLSKQGKYTKALIKPAAIVSDSDDSALCPASKISYSKNTYDQDRHTPYDLNIWDLS